MPKNTHGGKGHRRCKNKPNIKIRKVHEIAKDPNPEEYEVYGYVMRPLGSKRFEVLCQQVSEPSETTVLKCLLQKSCKMWINKGSYVLVKRYDFNENQGQIIDCYKEDEIASIKKANLWDFPDNNNTDAQVAPDSYMPEMDSSSDESDDEQPTVQSDADADDDDVNIDEI